MKNRLIDNNINSIAISNKIIFFRFITIPVILVINKRKKINNINIL